MGTPPRTFPLRDFGAALALCVLASMLAPPHPVHADVRPAVEVVIAGAPRAARAGRAFAGAFELRSGVALTVDSLRLSGEHWRIGRFAPRLPRALRTGERWRVSFRATPADVHRPLVLQVKSGRQWLRKEFDLSPEAVERARGPAGVSPHPPR